MYTYIRKRVQKKLILSVRINLSYSHEYLVCTMEKAVANSSFQSKIGDNNHQIDERDLNPTSHCNEAPAMQQQAQFTCSLYISRAGSFQDQGHRVQGDNAIICCILKKTVFYHLIYNRIFIYIYTHILIQFK